jgi:hypothetical protein
MGVLLLILGTGSLIFQYSSPVNVFAQVSVGPLWNMGDGNNGSDRSVRLDAESDGTDIFVTYEQQGGGVKLGKAVSGETEEDDPQVIINGGIDPAIDVTPGGQVKVAAEQQGKIAFVGCTDDDDNCIPSKIISNPTTVPPVGIEGEGSSTRNSCRDGLDNDGDNRIDTADTDCKWSSQQESSMRGLCSDGLDNDGDGVNSIDSDDADCKQPAGTAGAAGTRETAGAAGTRETAGAAGTRETAGAEDNGETAGAEDNGETAGAEDNGETAGAEDNGETAGVEPTAFNLQPGTTSTSPQLTFVQTGGGDAPRASNTDIASSNNGNDVYAVWQQVGGEIMLAASHNGGGTWGAIVNVSNTPGASTDPRVAISENDGSVHVTWQEDISGKGDIFYAKSTNTNTNGGMAFTAPINLSNTSGDSNDHQLVVEGSNVYVVWVDYTTNSGGEIYFKKIGNGTINLSASTGQSFQTSKDPDMAAHGSNVAVTWAGLPDRNRGQGEIALRESHNSGGTFDQQINVSQTPRSDSKEPQVAYIPESSDEIYLAFLDTGGPNRVSTTAGKFNVLATERDDGGRPFSPLVNLSDAPDPNPKKAVDASQLQLVEDVAVWDPSGRRG